MNMPQAAPAEGASFREKRKSVVQANKPATSRSNHGKEFKSSVSVARKQAKQISSSGCSEAPEPASGNGVPAPVEPTSKLSIKNPSQLSLKPHGQMVRQLCIVNLHRNRMQPARQPKLTLLPLALEVW